MRVEDLERALADERPEIGAEFARELDEWAAEGFPADTGPTRRPGWAFWARRATPARRLASRLAREARMPRISPRRLVAPAGALALLVVIGGVAISNRAPDDSGETVAPSIRAEQDETGERDAAVAPDAKGDAGAAVDPGAAPGAAETAASSGASTEAAGASAADRATLEEASRAAPGPGGRKIAQRVALGLATTPEDFRSAADGVLDVVAAERGFVVRSTVSSGDPTVEGAQPGQASFQLKIPVGRLQTALAALSELGHVVSRTDGADDITGRFVSAKERIGELTALRSRLLAELETAFTETEQESLRRRIRIVEGQLANAQEDLGAAQRRVSLVPVSVSIAADGAIQSDDGWTLGDALDDAADVLTTIGGIALVSLAILLPIAVIGAIAYAIAIAARRRGRERALGD